MAGCASADKGAAEAVGASVTAPASEGEAPVAVANEEPPTDEAPATGEVVEASMDKVECTKVDKSLPLEDRCAAAGAVVHEFPNTCVGKCSAIEEVAMCGQAFTTGCKCPEGQCIDDKTGCCRAIRK